MKTVVLDSALSENIDRCAKVITGGGVVAMPTETVYGLAANALYSGAVDKIYKIKGRQSDNPLIVHICSPSDVWKLVSDIPDEFKKLVDRFWPGPLTLIMKKSLIVPDNVTAGLDTVAIRMPAHTVALSLIEACGCPLAAPSANPSGRQSPTKAEHVLSDLGGLIPYVLDGGDCTVGVESTVLDISGEKPVILRPGFVTEKQILEVIGKGGYLPVSAASRAVRTKPNVIKSEAKGNVSTIVSTHQKAEPPRSPGMKYQHYAPKAPLFAVVGDPVVTANFIKKKLCKNRICEYGICKQRKCKVDECKAFAVNIDGTRAALMFSDFAIPHPNIVTYGRSDDFEAQAANLFDALRKFDAMNIKEIYAQVPPETGVGTAVANRLEKAAKSKIKMEY